MQSLYDKDFYAWTQQQAQALRDGAALDVENLIEEIESMGRREKRELVSRLELLLMHLLKWKYQPHKQSRSWKLTIIEQSRQMLRHLNENPSLKHHLSSLLEKAYQEARIRAEIETGMTRENFPVSCPWVWEQITDIQFLSN